MAAKLQKKAKGSKKTRKIGRNKERHQAHIRYRNENRGRAHQIAQIRKHLEDNPDDLQSQRKLEQLS